MPLRRLLGFEDVERASLWRRMAAMERAGIPIQGAIERLVAQGGAARVLEPVEADLAEGLSIGEAFARAEGLEELERRLVAAGSKGGRLPEVLEDLAAHFEDRAAVKRGLAAGLAYPVFLVHAAVFLPSLSILVSEGLLAFLVAVFGPLAVLYLAVGGCVVGWRALRAGSPRAADRLLLSVPILGGVVKKRAVATSLDVLRLLYASGIPVLEAAEAAAAACPNAEVASAFQRVHEALVEGMSLGLAFAAEPGMPASVVDMVATGESSGSLDDLLGRAARQLEDEAKLARRALIVAAGVAALMLGALVVAWKIFSFWAGYFEGITRAMEGF